MPMLDARYLLLHQALGLGPMWLNKEARLLDPAAGLPATEQIKPLQAERSEQAPPPVMSAKVKSTEEATVLAPSEIIHKIDTSGKDLATLASDSVHCQACSLAGCRRQAIFGQGNVRAGLLVLAASPTPEDDLSATLFYGKAGVLLSNMLQAIEVDIEKTYLTTAVKCAPSFGSALEATQRQTCQAFLAAQIRLIQPKAILALGEDMKKWAEADETGLRYQNIPFFVTAHPARLMRHPQEKAQAWDVLKQLRNYLSSVSSEMV